MKKCDVYFPNLKHVEIQIGHRGRYDLTEILKSFKNSKTLMVQFPYYKTEKEHLSEMLDKLDSIEILQNYQIKHANNYIQFLKETNE